MSTASVSSPKKCAAKQISAKWDDHKTRILLEVFETEIDNGNRPCGVFSREGWANIVCNFNTRTGLHYNKDQIKNKQDNLRKEFNKWEKLIGRETGLGWDPEKQTLSAPDAWWDERAKTDPSILKYRHSGPMHLELLQKVFSGITATGYYSYIPGDSIDPLLQPGDRLDDIEGNSDDVDHMGKHTDLHDDLNVVDEDPETMHTPNSGSLRGPKRKRLSSGSRLSACDKFHQSMGSFTSTLREGIERVNPAKGPDDKTLAYNEALQILKTIPGMRGTNPLFLKAVHILSDKMNQIVFEYLMEEGHDSVIAWIESLP